MCGIWISNESTDTTNSKHALMYHWDAEVGQKTQVTAALIRFYREKQVNGM